MGPIREDAPLCIAPTVCAGSRVSRIVLSRHGVDLRMGLHMASRPMPLQIIARA
eukprot:UN4489